MSDKPLKIYINDFKYGNFEKIETIVVKNKDIYNLYNLYNIKNESDLDNFVIFTLCMTLNLNDNH